MDDAVPTLPTPPPGPDLETARSAATVIGRLTPGWRAVTTVVWALAFLAVLGVWKTSRELGLNTWWLGPLGDPRPIVVSVLPLAAPTAAVIAVANNVHRATWVQFGAAAALAAVALGDVSYVPRLALVELGIAIAGALVTVAGQAGRYRAPA